MRPPTKKELIECLRQHVLYFDCHHNGLDDCCCTCEAKRLIQRYEHGKEDEYTDIFNGTLKEVMHTR